MGSDTNYGFFIDDIDVTNSSQLINTTLTQLNGTANSFNLDATTAGGTLINGTTYQIQIKPNVGTHWFPYGDVKSVTIQTPTGYAAWVTQFPNLGERQKDTDNDGIPNLMEYALGTNPIINTPPSEIPKPTLANGVLGMSFTPNPLREDVIYGAQWSTNLNNWTDIPNSGAGTTKTFVISATNQPRIFMRHHIQLSP